MHIYVCTRGATNERDRDSEDMHKKYNNLLDTENVKYTIQYGLYNEVFLLITLKKRENNVKCE